MNKETKAKAAEIKTFLIKVLESPNPLSDKTRDFVNRALQIVYANQTADEKASETTSHLNGMGFNGTDAEFLSNVAARSARYGLSEKQARAVAKCLRKYSGQIASAIMLKDEAQPAPAVAVCGMGNDFDTQRCARPAHECDGRERGYHESATGYRWSTCGDGCCSSQPQYKAA